MGRPAGAAARPRPRLAGCRAGAAGDRPGPAASQRAEPVRVSSTASGARSRSPGSSSRSSRVTRCGGCRWGMNCWTNGWPPGSLAASSRRRTPAGCAPAPRPPAPPATGCAATAAGHGVVRLLAAERLGLPAAGLRWRHGPNGKPEPAGPWTGPAGSGSTTRPPGRWRYWRRRHGRRDPGTPSRQAPDQIATGSRVCAVAHTRHAESDVAALLCDWGAQSLECSRLVTTRGVNVPYVRTTHSGPGRGCWCFAAAATRTESVRSPWKGWLPSHST